MSKDWWCWFNWLQLWFDKLTINMWVFILSLPKDEPASVVVVDLNENGLAELVRDVRSTNGLYVPDEFRCLVRQAHHKTAA